MSATFLFAQPDEVYLLADGAMSRNGVVEAIGGKVATFPKLRLAVAFQGWCNPHRIWNAMAAVAPRDLDGALAALPSIFHAMFEENRAAGVERLKLKFFAACWHPIRGRQLWMAHSDASELPPGIGPFALVRVRVVLDAVHDPGAVLGRSINFGDPASFDAAWDGLALMEAARREPRRDENGELVPVGERYGVGGFAELVTINAAGLMRRTLKEWPDRIGERINPLAAE